MYTSSINRVKGNNKRKELKILCNFNGVGVSYSDYLSFVQSIDINYNIRITPTASKSIRIT